MKCEQCGADVRIGAWPWCPHEDASSFGDPPMESYVDEHVAPGGRDVGHDSEGNPYYGHLITTRGERRRLMSRNHSDYHDVSGKKRGRVYLFVGGK
jgi:hypothetical protein